MSARRRYSTTVDRWRLIRCLRTACSQRGRRHGWRGRRWRQRLALCSLTVGFRPGRQRCGAVWHACMCCVQTLPTLLPQHGGACRGVTTTTPSNSHLHTRRWSTFLILFVESSADAGRRTHGRSLIEVAGGPNLVACDVGGDEAYRARTTKHL